VLALENVEVLYSDVILALKGITLRVPERSCVALLGPNGAGKSTTLKAISGIIRSEDGAVTGGSIALRGARIDGLGPEQIVRRGLVHVLEGRRVLEHMTAEQNLLVGGHLDRDAARVRDRLAQVYAAIPRLAALRGRIAGYLSGGEQQMLVIGRALMARPDLVLIDEPSLGLAPLIVEEVFAILRRLRAEGITLLIVEQNARAALDLADHAYVMENGRIVLEGAAAQLRDNEDIREFYLGLNVAGERKSFREVKHYRRRKRWLG
jgi:branched-chain amino acid transport system ATP-binding protein